MEFYYSLLDRLRLFDWDFNFGDVIAELIWCSSNVIINRIYVFHFSLGFLIGCFIFVHIFVLHSSLPSFNPLLNSCSSLMVPFYLILWNVEVLLWKGIILWLKFIGFYFTEEFCCWSIQLNVINTLFAQFYRVAFYSFDINLFVIFPLWSLFKIFVFSKAKSIK